LGLHKLLLRLLLHLLSGLSDVVAEVVRVDFISGEVLFLWDVAQLGSGHWLVLLGFFIFSEFLRDCFLSELGTLSLVEFELSFRNIGFIWGFSHFKYNYIQDMRLKALK
jgi:hypothetical protein